MICLGKVGAPLVATCQTLDLTDATLGRENANPSQITASAGVRALHVHLRLLLPRLHAALRASQVLRHLLGHTPLKGTLTLLNITLAYTVVI